MTKPRREKSSPHITVCICTFQRPRLLERLLNELDRQRTDGLFTYSVVVVDNDHRASGRGAVESFRGRSRLQVRYEVEPEQSIALARNRAVENARGEFIAFIDDDEFPGPSWLVGLFQALHGMKADGVLGPVLPHFETEPPAWVVKGKFYDRPSHPTGTVLAWSETRTGNVLLRRDLFAHEKNRFLPEFGSGGEDRDFFRRMISQGRRFQWCAEAPVFESVPPERLSRSFLLRRALLRGKTPYNHNLESYLRSLAAIPVYTLSLPVLFFVRHHLFMKYLVKYADHVGRLLALLGINVIKEKYILK